MFLITLKHMLNLDSCLRNYSLTKNPFCLSIEVETFSNSEILYENDVFISI